MDGQTDVWSMQQLWLGEDATDLGYSCSRGFSVLAGEGPLITAGGRETRNPAVDTPCSFSPLLTSPSACPQARSRAKTLHSLACRPLPHQLSRWPDVSLRTYYVTTNYHLPAECRNSVRTLEIRFRSLGTGIGTACPPNPLSRLLFSLAIPRPRCLVTNRFSIRACPRRREGKLKRLGSYSPSQVIRHHTATFRKSESSSV